MWRVSWRLLLSSCVAAGCSPDGPDGASDAAGEGGTGEVVCNPLAAQVRPIALDEINLVVRSADGTLYAIDDPDSTRPLLFVSNGRVLQQKRVVASESASSNDRRQLDQMVAFEDGSTPNRLVIRWASGVLQGVALVHDSERTFFDQLPASAERLMPADQAALAGLTIQSLSEETTLEHAAHTEDGARIFVTRPRGDVSYEDFRVFFGRDGVFRERGSVMVSRGSSTWITFELADAEALAVFVNPVLSPNLASSLTTVNGELALVLDDVTAGPPPGASFRCLR